MVHFVPDLIWRLRTPKGQDERAEICVFVASVQELRETLQVFSQTTWALGTTTDPSCITEGRCGCEHWRGGGTVSGALQGQGNGLFSLNI